jgi:hypothetical protein
MGLRPTRAGMKTEYGGPARWLRTILVQCG